MASSKNYTEVLIGGKVFNLGGFESEEYLQKVASYINGKMEEYSKMGTFTRQPMDTQNVLIQLNIADDYFKAKKQVELLKEEVEKKEKEIYDLKHELIAMQIKMESREKAMKGIQTEIHSAQKKLTQLEEETEKNKSKEKEKLPE